jgi:hypothetical protein
VAPCRYGVNRRFGGTYRLHLQGIREIIRKSAREASVRDVTFALFAGQTSVLSKCVPAGRTSMIQLLTENCPQVLC